MAWVFFRVFSWKKHEKRLTPQEESFSIHQCAKKGAAFSCFYLGFWYWPSRARDLKCQADREDKTRWNQISQLITTYLGCVFPVLQQDVFDESVGDLFHLFFFVFFVFFTRWKRKGEKRPTPTGQEEQKQHQKTGLFFKFRNKVIAKKRPR